MFDPRENNDYRYGYHGYDNYNRFNFDHPTSVPDIPVGVVIFAFSAVFLGTFLFAAAGIGILIYTLLRVVLAPLSSVIDIYANWGNLYHERSKKSLQYQLLSLGFLAIGGVLFCTKIFNPFSGMGIFAQVVAITVVTASVLISTAISRYFATKCYISKIATLLDSPSDLDRFSDSLWGQTFFGQDDVFMPGVPGYQAFFPKFWLGDNSEYELFLQGFNKLDRRGRLNIEKAEGLANFNCIWQCSRKNYHSDREKYRCLTSVARAMVLLDDAGLLNQDGRELINGLEQVHENVIRGYIAEQDYQKKKYREPGKRASSTTILNQLNNARDPLNLAAHFQRRAEAFNQLNHLPKDLAILITDYLDEAEVSDLEVKAENNGVVAGSLMPTRA